MKKRILTFLLCGIFCACLGLFAGCGASNNKTTETKSTTTITNIEDLSKVYDGESVDEPTYTTTNTEGTITITFYVKNSTTEISAPKNAGTYTVRIIISEGKTQKACSGYKNFTISKADANYTGSTISLTGTYSSSQTLADFALPANFVWKDATTIVPTCDVTTYTAIYNPDSTNYNGQEVAVTLILSKATPVLGVDYTIPQSLGAVNGTKLSALDLSKYNLVWMNENQEVSSEQTTYYAKFVPTDDINVDSVENIAIAINIYSKAVQIPTINDYSIVYSGSLQSIEKYLSYDTEKITISGETSATNAGEYTILFSIDSSYCWSNGTVGDWQYVWTISKADANYTGSAISLSGTYSSTQTLANFALPANFIWKDATLIPTCDVATYTAIYNPDSANYNGQEVAVTLSLAKATPTYTIPTNLTGTADKTLSTITLPNGFSWSDGSQTILSGQNSYLVTFTPTDTINYNVISNIEVVVEGSSYTFTITYTTGTSNAYSIEKNSNGEYTITFGEITADTEYSISGTLDGNIVVDVVNDYDFTLGLNGVTITSYYESPIAFLSGKNADVSVKSETTNYVYDKRKTVTDETAYSASIYSVIDLDLKGKGSLTVASDNNNGIHTKDDLEVKNLTLSVTCVDNALKGNDSVTIESGTLTLIATKGDGIKTSNSDYKSDGTTVKGTIQILSGTIDIYAACDGIDASYNVDIQGATINIYTDKYSEYSEEVTDVSSGEYYIKSTSTTYQYSIYYYNSSTSAYVWKNATYYTSAGSQGGRPGSSTTYYYYTIEKPSGYDKMVVYAYSSSQTQGQNSSYYSKSSTLTVNDSYDTISTSISSSSISCSWTNYTTTQGPGGMGGGTQEGNSDKGDYSTKGIKADNAISISGGTIYVKSYDDAIHVNTDVTLECGVTPTGILTISGGTLTLYSNDDGIHSDNTLIISGGTINVTYSYEGVEANQIQISGGSTTVYAKDDAMNAAACNSSSTPLISISGGYVDLDVASGDTDTMDSNGNITITGGVIIAKNRQSSSTSMTGGTIDLDGTFTLSGNACLLSIGCWCNEVNKTANASSSSTISGTHTLTGNGNTYTISLATSYTGYRLFYIGTTYSFS
jgi:hypothetical protein